jgi:hypothetical protein
LESARLRKLSAIFWVRRRDQNPNLLRSLSDRQHTLFAVAQSHSSSIHFHF